MNGGYIMTVKELKALLEDFDNDKSVFVFIPESSTLYEATEIRDNNGNVQINVE